MMLPSPLSMNFQRYPLVHDASYQWDKLGTHDELEKGGFGNQCLFVDRDRDLVIAYFGTNATVDAPWLRLPLRELAVKYYPQIGTAPSPSGSAPDDADSTPGRE